MSNVIFDMAGKDDISELVRLRIAYMIDDFGTISVYTESEYRGKGICTQLMKNMIEFAKENKLCRIDLMATDEGYPVYKKVGFEDRTQKYIDMRLKL